MELPCASMPKVITVMEAAERLGVHHSTIRRWIRAGRLRPYKLMGDTRRYVSTEEVKALREPQLLRPPKPSVAACYIVQDGRLLMVRRRFAEGTLEWAGPSDNIHPGETPEQAAVRECQEELGIRVEVVRRLGDRLHPATDRHLIYLACRLVSGEPVIVDHEEIAAVEWADWETVQRRWATLKGGIFPAVREYLERALQPV